MKKHIFYLTLILLVPLTLYILSLQTVSVVPSDANHIGITEEKGCFECHGEDKEFPRKKSHPPKDQCFKCHKADKAPAKTQG